MKHLLSIGQFAKLCQTTTDTLVHYENLKLLCPSQATGTNRHRRMYDIGQYHTFYIIHTLSNVGISLAEIKNLLTFATAKTLTTVLRQKEADLRLRINQLKQTADYFENLQNHPLLPSDSAFGQPFVQIQNEPLLLFVTHFGYYPFSPFHMITAVTNHQKECLANDIYPYPLGMILPKKSLYAQNNRQMLLYSPYPDGTVTNKTPIQCSGEYAVILHKGSFESINDSIELLYRFVTKHRYLVASDTYINFYHNSLPDTSDSFYLVKIRFCRT